MSRQLRFYGLVGLVFLYLFFLLLNQHYNDKNWETLVEDTIDNVTPAEIQDVIDWQRWSIERDTEGYDYPNGRYGINASKLEDLVMEKGGRPTRSVILTTWRSGSTFFGDIMNAHPASYYHFEPLMDFGVVQIRTGGPLARKALKNIRSLFACNYEDMRNYVNFGKTRTVLLTHNTNLWRQCQAHTKICWEPRFLSRFCRLFPFQLMKLARLRLRFAEELLEQTSLGVRLIFLVRDPRGALQSRKHREWCQESPDCSNPVLLCSDMVSDFEVARRLIKKYPTTFRVVRYEDLSLDVYKYTKDVYNFYGLNFHANVKRFLDTHTKSDDGDRYSTFRNSRTTPFHWRNDLNFKEVDEIQRACVTAMRYWGYVPAHNASHQREFDPTTGYSLEWYGTG